MNTSSQPSRQSPWIIFLFAAVAIMLAGCSSSNVGGNTQVNPLLSLQTDGNGTTTLPTDGTTQGVGKIDKPIVTIPYPTDGRSDHTNAPLLSNFHPGWQQNDCYTCHSDQSRIPDHSYPDTSLCYLCHGTNGLPGFGDATPPIIKGIIAGPTGDGVTITWSTDEACISRLTLVTKDGDRMDFPVSTDYVVSHKYSLTGLLPSTTYNYVITAMDRNGNTSTTQSMANLNFTTTNIVTGGTNGVPVVTNTFFLYVKVPYIGYTKFDVEASTREACQARLIVKGPDGKIFESNEWSTYGSNPFIWTYTHSLLQSKSVYEFYIRAVDKAGLVHKSAKKKVTTLGGDF